jgi:hypothetical protein
MNSVPCCAVWGERRSTFLTLLTLAIGIGANGHFQRDNGVLLKPSLPDPDRLVASGTAPGLNAR